MPLYGLRVAALACEREEELRGLHPAGHVLGEALELCGVHRRSGPERIGSDAGSEDGCLPASGAWGSTSLPVAPRLGLPRVARIRW